MIKSIAVFGYNTDKKENRIDWEHVGTKYNFNLEGNILGLFSDGEHTYLLTQVTKSRADNCTVGTIDAREVCVLSDKLLLSNNDISLEANDISIALSTKEAREELEHYKKIELTDSFSRLENVLEKQDAAFAPRVTVCGIEKKSFLAYQKANKFKKHLI